MSARDDEDLIPLRDLFQQSLAQSGGDPSRAFIAILDELDARAQGSDDLAAQNTSAFEALAQWYNRTNQTLTKLPGEMHDQAGQGVRWVLPEIKDSVATNAAMGARQGAAPTHEALEALREAAEAYESKIRRLTLWAAVGAPLVWLTLIAFTSLVIPALPADWEWPCAIIGADFRAAADPNSNITYCLVQR